MPWKVSDVKMLHAEVVAAVRVASVAPLERCGMIVETEAKRLLSKGGGAGGVPSPPGLPPHLQTGALRGGVMHALTLTEGCIVGPVDIYGKFHEYGSKKHPERPFMRPALRNSVGQFPGEFEGMI